MRTALCLVALIVLVNVTRGGLINKPGLPLPNPGGLPLLGRPDRVPTPSDDVSTVVAGDFCIPLRACDSDAIYRTINGSCNNLVFSMWGQANTALSRIAPAQFQDGVNEPRKAKSGKDLPNVRDIVVNAFSFVKKTDHTNTLALMTVGQLLSHDAALIEAPLDRRDTCCTQGGSNCMNIAVSPTDPFYGQYNVTCLPMTRTPTTASLNCPLKPEYTMTKVTHFIDASFVYGSSDQVADSIREKSQGRLKEDIINGNSFPPHNSHAAAVCVGENKGALCMNAGDTRANQNPPLGTMQILFFREHNRLADELAKLNPKWDDERLYQEARRILIAEWQIIVYRDYIPYIIGQEAAKSERLIPNLETMSDDYHELYNPSTTTDFTSAAFRVFHGQIPSAYCDQGPDNATGCPCGADRFSNTYDNPEALTSVSGFRSILYGLARQNGVLVDNTFSIEVAGRLFRTGKPWGHDLISTDIARGRDVGLPPYNTYRSLCGMEPARTWLELLDSFTPENIVKLRSLYESPDDIDLFVAGTLEKKNGTAVVGPIFECILVDQFKAWKKGDRFFVDLKGFKHSFTKDQAQALASTSLARLFCDNGEDVMEVPKDIFLLQSETVPCTTLPSVDLAPWIST